MLKSLRSSRIAAALMVAGLLGTALPGSLAQDARSGKRIKMESKGEAPEGITPFTAGNIVVCRIGVTGTPLSSAATATFLDEYTPSGTLVGSVALPTADSGTNQTLTNSGTGSTDCQITRSADGRYIVITGYDAAPGTAAVSGTATTAVQRTIGRVNNAKQVDTSTTTTSFNAGAIRSATSDGGTGIWAAGANTGVIFTPLGTVGTPGTVVSSDSTNNRQVAIFGGQLYLSSGAGTNTFRGVNTVGTGLPTTTGAAINRLPGLTDASNPSTYSYYFADLNPAVAGYDTLYFADDGAGALSKFSLVGGTWTFNGVVGIDTDDYRGLVGVVGPGSTVTLYATRHGGTGATGGGELVSLVDASGYNGAFAGTPVVLATAVTQTAFRGVALAPVATTAAGVTIAGRVLSGERGIRNARVTISGGDLAEPITVFTGPRGQFAFNDIPAGRSYVVSVAARRFQFATGSQIVEVNDNVSGIDFFASDGR
jgi:hypothetical protein